ncbi:hypothetical protein LJK88_39055 [Paenibacillus sp. P26]|nr:hypothetical protein LJK88_39055 [Paenibacillus sp. P26]
MVFPKHWRVCRPAGTAWLRGALCGALSPSDSVGRRRTGLRHWLDAFAGKLLEGLDAPGREKAYSLCEERLRPDLFDGEQWTADYRRLRVAAVKL